ncbi:adenine nucleotide transporter [Fomitiporia mediterranea MF3/22]|uniref:adenine nucleotide transporter n=1 Tax=Fomitiporia mediterranea (strain MF3/22) TaxID=694068 RepID=UPI000440977D|nr:adenine nucleotide transporter [Fomitiporia mediterranea MF3/22]EJD06515.1 adenine nucleotide transporter [Fomitiporia mediterranea MF3/22]
MSASKPQEQLTPFGYALAGALGGVFSNAVVYPLDTVKTRIQAGSTVSTKGKKHDVSIISLLLRILREEGVSAFYNGFGASMLNTFSTQYAYFLFYSFVRGSYLKRLSSRLPKGSKVPTISTAMELLLGAVAGALAQIFTIPVSVIATRQQIGRLMQPNDGPAPSSPSKVSPSKPSYSEVADPRSSASAPPDSTFDNSFLTVGKEIIRTDGVTGLWLGLKPSLVLTVNPAITYGVFERIKSLMLVAKEKAGGQPRLTPWQNFFVGALSKTLATVVTYPYIMAKVKIQAGTQNADAELPSPGSAFAKKPKNDGAITLLTRIVKERGLIGWYQGMSAQIIKAVLSQALLFMSKDQFEQYALMILIAQRKFASS